MIIEAIEIENFLSHRKTSLRLGSGVIAIVGPNGAGKTSIIDAITYTLFDSHSRDTRRKDDIIRLGAPSARILVRIRVGARTYDVEKVVQRGSPATQARLYIVENGTRKLLAYGVKNVAAELTRILGFDPKLANLILVTRQGEIEGILNNKRDRIELISTLLKLKAMDEALNKLKELIRIYDRKRGYYKGRMETLLKNIELLKADAKRLEELHAKKTKLAKELSRLREELRKYENRLRELEEATKKYTALKVEAEHVTRELESIKLRLREVEAELREAERAAEDLELYEEKLSIAQKVREANKLLSEVKALEKLIKEYERKSQLLAELEEKLRALRDEAEEYLELEEKLKELKHFYEEYNAIEVRLKDLEDKLRRLKSEEEIALKAIISEIETELPLQHPQEVDKLTSFIDGVISDIDSRVERLRNRLKELEGMRSAEEQQLRYIENVLMSLTSARGKCPLCGQPLTEEHRTRLIARFRDEKRQVRERLKNIEDSMRAAEAEIDRLTEFKERMKKLRSRIEKKVQNIAALREVKASIEDEMKRLAKRKLEIMGRVKEYMEASKRLEQLRQKFNEYIMVKARFEEAKKSVESLKEVKERYEAMLGELNNILSELGITTDEIDSLNQEAEEIISIIGELRAKAGRLNKLRGEYETLRAEAARLEERLASIMSELDTLEDIVKDYETVKDRYENLRGEVERVERELAGVSTLIDELEKRVKSLKLQERELAEVKAKLEKLNKAIGFLEKLKKLLSPDGIPRLVRLAAKNVLEYHLRDILSAFNIEFADVKLDDDYGVTLVTRYGEKKAGMLSGGERVALAIAYRLALARMVGSRIETMIMDEPTIHLDEERRRELINIIKHSLASTGLSQLIVVTHDREVEDAADVVVEVEKGADGSSVVRVVGG